MATADGVYLRRMVCRPELVLVAEGAVADVEAGVEFAVPAADFARWATADDGWPARLADIAAQFAPTPAPAD